MSAADSGAARLRSVLGAAPPAGIAALPDGALAELAGIVEQAGRAQRRALTAAAEDALRHVPFPARRLVRKALFGQ